MCLVRDGDNYVVFTEVAGENNDNFWTWPGKDIGDFGVFTETAPTVACFRRCLVRDNDDSIGLFPEDPGGVAVLGTK